MKSEEIRKMSVEEMQAKLSDMREELMKLRFQQVTGQLTDTSRLRLLRRYFSPAVASELAARGALAERPRRVDPFGAGGGQTLPWTQDVQRINASDGFGIVAAVEQEARFEIVGDGVANPGVAARLRYRRHDGHRGSEIGLADEEEGAQ